MAVILIIEGKDGSSRNLQLGGNPVIIGRSSSCHLKLDDSMISGKHCAFKLSATGKVLVKDMGTTNGTLLNGSRIQDTQIYCEDIITIGGFSISIDESQLSPKEAKSLKRDEPTAQVKFVNLNGSTARKQASKTPPKPSEILKKKQMAEMPKPAPPAPTPSPASDMNIGTSEFDSLSSDETKSANHTHTVKASPEELGPRQEMQIEMEASTGETKMIKIDKPGSLGNTKKKSTQKKKVSKKGSKSAKESKSLSDKLKGLFKKD